MGDRFIILGDTRIKASNIKQYGLSTKRVPREEKIYEIKSTKQLKVFKVMDFITGEEQECELIWNGKTEPLEDARFADLKNGKAQKRIISGDTITDSNKEITTTDDSDDSSVVWKSVSYLYVTTFQGEEHHFLADRAGFNIQEKCKELDELLANEL